MNKARSLTLDFARGMAVILVVLGHSIQYGAGSDYYTSLAFFANPLFEFIYSFHMPLFAVISGYCFWFTTKNRTFAQTLINRVQRIFVPMLAWQFVLNGYEPAKELIQFGGGRKLLLQLITGYRDMPNRMWFLWSMLVLSLGVAVVHYVFCDNLVLFSIGFIVTPFLYKLDMLLWLYPFFVGAYLMAKYKDVLGRLVDALKRHGTLFILFVIQILLTIFWKPDYYIYTSVGLGLTIYGQTNIPRYLIAAVYRIIAGGIGSVMALLASYRLTLLRMGRKKAVSYLRVISRYTLGIYVFSVHIVNGILLHLPISGFSLTWILLETATVLAISIAIMGAVDRNHFTRELLLGGRYDHHRDRRSWVHRL